MPRVHWILAGDNALLAQFPDADPGSLAGMAEAIRRVAGVRAAIVGHSSVYVLVLRGTAPRLAEALETMAQLRAPHSVEPVRRHDIAVNFAPEHGPDLPRLLARTGMTRETFLREVQTLRLRARYLGFLPGFAYLEGVPERWSLPRLETPRTRVSAGSFGVVSTMAGFYPSESPGGWNLLGRTSAVFWDPEREPPNLIRPGDELVIGVSHDPVRELPPPASNPSEGSPAAEVVRPGQRSMIVGASRMDRYRYGVAAGGFFDREAAAAANRAVGNAPDAAVIECVAVGPSLRVVRDSILSWYGASAEIFVDGEPIAEPRQFHVRDGSVIDIGVLRDGFRGWMAMSGGLSDPAARFAASPKVLEGIIRVRDGGSLRARITTLRRSDPRRLRVARGPHPIDTSVLSEIANCIWTVTPAVDRIGVRLVAERAWSGSSASLDSYGMQFGTVQWHPNGELVVMGPDHPVTGGYLQPLTLLEAERWKLAWLAPGDRVRFVLSEEEDGRGKRI